MILLSTVLMYAPKTQHCGYGPHERVH